MIQPQTIPKLYSTGAEQASAHEMEPPGRYNGCIETCNSLDSRWKKFSTSKYRACCSRSAQFDPQYDQTNSDKVGDSSYKYADDAYYNYLYRKSRSRRSRRTYRGSNRYHRYSPSTASSVSHPDDESASGDLGGESGRQNPGRSYGHYEASPHMKYYKSRQQSSGHETADSSRDGPDVVGGKYPRAHRRGRNRDYESSADVQPLHDTNEDEGSDSPRSSTGYGSGEYSVDAERFLEPRSPKLNEDDETRNQGFEEPVDQDSARGGQGSDGSEHPVEQAPADTAAEEGEPETSPNYKYAPSRRRKYSKTRSRKSQAGKDPKFYKKGRKGRFYKQEQAPSQTTNGTEPSGHSEQYNNQEQTPINDQEDQANQKDSAVNESGEAEKEVLSLANKYRASLNESAVANLSKTTMQLKEILSILEKKAQLKANDSTSAPPSQQQITSTPTPATTTGLYSPSSIYNLPSYGSSSIQSALGSDYLNQPELSLKSPYRYEHSSLPSVSSSSLSIPSSYSSLSSDAFSSIPGYSASHYSLATQKHLPLPSSNLPRKRRTHKSMRYNNMMIPKSHNLHASASSIMPTSSKSNFLNPYYSLQYPYWYPRGASPQVTNSYPYRNLMKNPYSSLLNGSAKLAAAATGAHYSDESRIHSLTYDPLSNVASSLRPSTMRLRSKPFVFQPHVLPIYTRHTILTPDVKKK